MSFRFGFFFVVLSIGLSACADRSFTPVTPEALELGTPKVMHGATSRAPDSNGGFGPERGIETTLVEMVVSIPPSHTPGALKFGYANPDPATEFTLAAQQNFDSDAAFRSSLKKRLSNLPRANREAMIFIHGFNSTHTEAAFRAAQLSHDIRVPGASLFYSLPSQGNPLGYAYDGDSALFARDGLQHLIEQVHTVGVERLILIAHSMGSMVLMETLRQMDLEQPGWVGRNIGGVILISPDLDIEVFRTQIKRLSPPPEPFLVFVSQKDNILNLSRRLRGTHSSARLGNLENIALVSDLPISVVDTTDFVSDAESSHFVPATSPALLAILSSAAQVSSTLEPDARLAETFLPGSVTVAEDAVEVRVDNPATE